MSKYFYFPERSWIWSWTERGSGSTLPSCSRPSHAPHLTNPRRLYRVIDIEAHPNKPGSTQINLSAGWQAPCWTICELHQPPGSTQIKVSAGWQAPCWKICELHKNARFYAHFSKLTRTARLFTQTNMSDDSDFRCFCLTSFTIFYQPL
jgi:hypothetical protein